MEKATFAAGCFWDVEEAFRHLPGVISTVVGFMGGSAAYPSYRDVCSGRTGHAEVVEVTYDPKQINYAQLLELFWAIHDPTRSKLNNGEKDQYRSAIFFHTPEQEAAAHAMLQALRKSRRFHAEIATEIAPATQFYRAEEHHQRYLEKRGRKTL